MRATFWERVKQFICKHFGHKWVDEIAAYKQRITELEAEVKEYREALEYISVVASTAHLPEGTLDMKMQLYRKLGDILNRTEQALRR